MTERFLVLEEFAAWIAGIGDRLAADGLVVAVDCTPPDGRAKAAAWVDLESAQRLGRLIVWGSGEAELELAEVATGGVQVERREITSRAELAQAANTLVAWVSPASAR